MTVSHSLAPHEVPQDEAAFAAMRDAMIVSQLRTCDVNDPIVLSAMRAVPREHFVGTEQRATCYHDRAVPLGNGRMLSPPLMLGRMLIEAAPKATDRVLIVAGGTGYSAAVLSPLVAQIVMVESDAALLAHAQSALIGYSNIEIIGAPLPDGYAAPAPYDLILIDGAVEEVSTALVEQLAETGRLVTGLSEGAVGRLALGRRAGSSFALVAFADMEVPPLSAFKKVRGFQF